MKVQHTFNLRLPLDLWTMLCAAASENSRSVNGEIIQRLRRSFEGYRR
jgi:predicted HicB family RNase H-like nuclease